MARTGTLFTYNRDYHRVLSEYAGALRADSDDPALRPQAPGSRISISSNFPDTLESQQPDFKRYDQRYLKGEVSRLRENLIPFRYAGAGFRLAQLRMAGWLRLEPPHTAPR